MEERPRMFIGSSVEGLPIAKAIQANLDYECETTLWSQGVFGLGGGTLESLGEALHNYDFACLVLTPDDMVTSRKSSAPSPRDNVLLELGLFISALGRRRTFIVYDRTANLRLPSDLAGVTAATFQPHASRNWFAALGAACTQIESAVKEFGVLRRVNESQPSSCRVEIYYHDRGLTQDDADSMVKRLKEQGITSIVLEHVVPDCPDALFIGSLVRAADARLVFSLLTYEVKYLFRPDYAESEGGDSRGTKIGIGYVSHYNSNNRDRRSEPVPVSRDQLAELISPRKIGHRISMSSTPNHKNS